MRNIIIIILIIAVLAAVFFWDKIKPGVKAGEGKDTGDNLQNAGSASNPGNVQAGIGKGSEGPEAERFNFPKDVQIQPIRDVVNKISAVIEPVITNPAAMPQPAVQSRVTMPPAKVNTSLNKMGKTALSAMNVSSPVNTGVSSKQMMDIPANYNIRP